VTPGTISLDNVAKRFMICHEKARSFQDALVQFVHRRNGATEEFWALRDVSFSVGPGETLGLIGRNGSGKSTTLKLITRILSPTSGKVNVRGRVSALIELGTGFHPDLTGRENIFLNGSIFGYGRKAMNAKFDDIVAFAELERFIDTPVKHYSSGMYARLGFSVATSVDPDILIVDEVLSVGDESFQRKCLARIDEFRRLGKTILFVSHSLSRVETLCDRVLWLDGGRVRAEGTAVDMVREYLATVDGGPNTPDAVVKSVPATLPTTQPRSATRSRVLRVTVLDNEGRSLLAVKSKRAVRVRVDFALAEDYSEEYLGLRVDTADAVVLHWSEARLADVIRETAPGQGYAVLEFASLPLRPGSYEITAGLSIPSVSGSWLADEQSVCGFTVEGEVVGKMVLELPCRWLTANELGEAQPACPSSLA
jgi:ABC-type polysaccharide/polyol phosphate transport system ATPase subunit